LSSRPNTGGYLQTALTIKGKTKFFLVSRLVASAYLGLNIEDTTVDVDHIDGNILNNNISNLQVLSKECHLDKTLNDRGFRKVKKCISCSKVFKDLTIEGTRLYCITCDPDKVHLHKDLNKANEIEYLVRSTGSWVQAAKIMGLSDNGLRKRYRKYSGKDPKTIKGEK